jgi:hypothetical protein
MTHRRGAHVHTDTHTYNFLNMNSISVVLSSVHLKFGVITVQTWYIKYSQCMWHKDRSHIEGRHPKTNPEREYLKALISVM